MCYLGDRLLAYNKILNNDTGEMECNKFENGTIYALYCDRVKTDPETGQQVPVTAENDEYCQYFHQHNVSLRPGIPGLASGVFLSKLFLCRVIFLAQEVVSYSRRRKKIKTHGSVVEIRLKL